MLKLTVSSIFLFLSFFLYNYWSIEKAIASNYPDPYLVGTNYSIGYKKLSNDLPHVWYWGWDNCNCNPKDLKCAFDPYNQGKVCSAGATGSYPYGDFGSYRFTWGLEDPQKISNFLEQAGNMQLVSGNYTKPIWVTGPTFTGSDGAVYVPQNRATKLYCGIQDGKEVYKWVANYSSLTSDYITWIKQVALLIKNSPNFAGITITHGLDGESSCKADQCGVTYPDGTKVPDPCTGYEKYRQDVTAAYYENFCNGTYDKNTGFCLGTMKPLFYQTDTFGDTAGTLGRYNPPMGMKFSGFVPDTVGVIYGEKWRGYGLVEGFARYRNLIPTAIEPKFGNWFLDNHAEVGGQGTYWWNLEALWLRPTYIDINPSYGLRWQVWEDQDYFDLINNHLNVSARTTPDVWIALRDTPIVCDAKTFDQIENNDCAKKASGSSGKIGDYDFFLRRPDGIPGNKTVALSRPDVYGNNLTIDPLRLYNLEIPQAVWQNKYSRHIRRTDKATNNYYMSFDVDNDYPYSNISGQNFEITIYYLDLGSVPFYVEYLNAAGSKIQKSVTRTDSKTWKKSVLTLSDTYFNDRMDGKTDFRIFNGGASSNDVYLHMIKVKGVGQRPQDMKKDTNILCSLNNESVIQGEAPELRANLIDENGKPLQSKAIRASLDSYWYSNRNFYGSTDNSGNSKLYLDLTGLTALFQQGRGAHEVEVFFPGDKDYYASSSLCYFPLNIQRSDVKKRTISATLSKNQVGLGETVTVTINAVGGGTFSVEGEGFGMPACYGEVNQTGQGTCSFKIGGMALPGRRNLGVIVAWNPTTSAAAASVNLPITILGDAPTPTAAPIFSLPFRKGYNNFVWQTAYPSNKSFSTLTDMCFAVETKNLGFWVGYIKNYGGKNLNFTVNKKYIVKCYNN